VTHSFPATHGPGGAGSAGTAGQAAGPVTGEPAGPAAGQAVEPAAGQGPAGLVQEQGAGPVADESLADALGAVARRLRDKSAETLAPWGITPAHLRALRVLARHGTMRLSELSERLQIAPRTGTEVVDALQAQDLVRRRADPADRRATLAEVTEHGAAILAEIRAARGPEASRVFGRLTPADRAELARILGKLRD